MKRLAFLAVVPFVVFACHPTDDPNTKPDAEATDAASSTKDATTSDGGGGDTACYIADQLRCHEFPEPTGDQVQNLAIECSSDSGNLSSSCPTTGFIGKCTLGAGPGREVRRFYTGADGAYQQDFCVNTAHGVWSTTF